MIQRLNDTIYNIIDSNTNESMTFTKVENYYDGSIMNDSKCDGDIYRKLGAEYFQKNLGASDRSLEKESIAALRSLSDSEILLLKMGHYKSVRVLGYYTKGDTPAPIQYYLSDTTEVDDGGSVFDIGGIKLEHDFGGVINPRYYGAKGDNLTDDVEILQSLFDIGGGIDLDEGTYLISKPLEIRRNIGLYIIGTSTNRPASVIKTTNNFNGRSMTRQWSNDWYSPGEIDQDVPPSDVSSHWQSIDRYVNIKNIEFYIDSDNNGEITCLDFISLQETSKWEGLVFNGDQNVEKGVPIRIRATPTGNEVSMNGFEINGVTVYGSKWRSEFICIGNGSDVKVKNWVTAQNVHKDSPFITGIINCIFSEIHSEAYSLGKPTFLNQGTDCRVVDSFIIIKNGQGDVFKSVNPYGGGNSISGFNIQNLRTYPEGGNSANILNLDSIYLLNDESQMVAGARRIKLALGGKVPVQVYYANRFGGQLVNTDNGNVLNIELNPGTVKQKIIEYVPSGGGISSTINSGTTITITDDSFLENSKMTMIYFSAGSAFGASGADYFNNPQSGRITLYSSYNGSEYRRKATIHNDVTPALFSINSWDSTSGTLTLNVLVSCSNLKLLITNV